MNGRPADYWRLTSDGKIQCEICPNSCRLKPGKRGKCFVRQRVDDQMFLTAYGRGVGFCVDPIEKKPLNHFYPGSPILSFGTIGCNLSCKFCQNWSMSRAEEFNPSYPEAAPGDIALTALHEGCQSVAFTYNEPIVFLEYARDAALACRANNIKTVAVTNGYVQGKAREDFFSLIDAANVDLKSFSKDFYKTLTGGDLQTVLDTLTYIKNKTEVWLEVATLLIPGENDGEEEIKRLASWIFNELGPETPVHFSAFYPNFKMRSKPPASLDSLVKAREIALDIGLYYVYTGNVDYPPGDITLCRDCGEELIVRSGYRIAAYRLTPEGECQSCGAKLHGRFSNGPGKWGSRRKPINAGF